MKILFAFFTLFFCFAAAGQTTDTIPFKVGIDTTTFIATITKATQLANSAASAAAGPKRDKIDSAYDGNSTASLWKLQKVIDSLKSKVARVILSSNTQLSTTGTLVETTVYTGTIPANSIGANGSFHITTLTTWTNNANAKVLRVKLNGNAIQTVSETTGASNNAYTIIRNRNSGTAQVTGAAAATANTTFASATGSGVSTFSIDTTAPITVTVTISLAVTTDTMSLEAFELIANP